MTHNSDFLKELHNTRMAGLTDIANKVAEHYNVEPSEGLNIYLNYLEKHDKNK